MFSSPQMEALQNEIGGVNLPLELTLHLLGLRGVFDTVVGNAAVRGVSGGERHRVTTAEMVSGKSSMHIFYQKYSITATVKDMFGRSILH